MESHELEAFRDGLKDLREKRGLSQELFALGAEIDQSYLSKLERGATRLTGNMYNRIMTFINSDEYQTHKR